MSQYVWIRPLKTLNALTSKSAFEKVLKNDPVAKRIRSRIRRVVTDQGGVKRDDVYHVIYLKVASIGELSIDI